MIKIGSGSNESVARDLIKSLYNTISWYIKNPGVGRASIILQYYGMWKDLRTISVNISSNGWNALTDIARSLK